jgi:hypothetical protein
MGLSSQLFARALGVETKRRFWMPSRQCHQKSSSGLFVVEAAALASVSQHAPLIIFPAKAAVANSGSGFWFYAAFESTNRDMVS